MKARALSVVFPWDFHLPVLRGIVALAVFTLLSTVARAAADDPYWRWAVAHFTEAVASDPAQQSTVWGENADPDRDGIRNLLEYTADTDPLARTSLSDVFNYSPTLGASAASHPQLIAWQRTDDPDLRVLPQVFSDCQTWFPAPPPDLTQPLPLNIFATATDGVSVCRRVQARQRKRRRSHGLILPCARFAGRVAERFP